MVGFFGKMERLRLSVPSFVVLLLLFIPVSAQSNTGDPFLDTVLDFVQSTIGIVVVSCGGLAILCGCSWIIFLCRRKGGGSSREIHAESHGLSSKKAPEGELCLMFSDVESSTKLWETDAQMMEAALNLHNELIRKLIKKYQGYEVKTEGDAFMVAFSSGPKCIEFMMATQLELLNLDWPEALIKLDIGKVQLDVKTGQRIYRGLRIRMGAHIGEPIAKKDECTKRMDYLGPMVNKSARVASLAAGGQIVLSHDLMNCLHDYVVSSGQNLSIPYKEYDHGQFSLKGIEGQEKVYEVLPVVLSGRGFKNIKGTATDEKELEKKFEGNDPPGGWGAQGNNGRRSTSQFVNALAFAQSWRQRRRSHALAAQAQAIADARRGSSLVMSGHPGAIAANQAAARGRGLMALVLPPPAHSPGDAAKPQRRGTQGGRSGSGITDASVSRSTAGGARKGRSQSRPSKESRRSEERSRSRSKSRSRKSSKKKDKKKSRG